MSRQLSDAATTLQVSGAYWFAGKLCRYDVSSRQSKKPAEVQVFTRQGSPRRPGLADFGRIQVTQSTLGFHIPLQQQNALLICYLGVLGMLEGPRPRHMQGIWVYRVVVVVIVPPGPGLRSTRGAACAEAI